MIGYSNTIKIVSVVMVESGPIYEGELRDRIGTFF